MHKVGAKGQVVIEKEIRDQLGIKPGWLALQRVVDGRVEIHFLPPEHDESLMGILAPYIKPEFRNMTEEQLNRACEQAWAEAAWEKERPWLERS